MVEVLLVDDNEIERVGREHVLRRRGHVVDAVDWASLRAKRSDADVVLAVVRRDTSKFDRWESLRLAGPMSRMGKSSAKRVALTVDTVPISPLSHLRLRRSGADAVLPASSVATGELLDDLVRNVPAEPPRPWRIAVERVEVGPNCDPRSVVAHVVEKAALDPSFLRAFEPGMLQNRCGLTRRRAHTLRVNVAKLGDLRALVPASGGPVRDQSLPRWSDMVAFVNQCRGWHQTDGEAPDSELPLARHG